MLHSSTDYGLLQSPISPGARNEDPFAEPGASARQASWPPAAASSAQHGGTTYGIEGMSIGGQPSHQRKKSDPHPSAAAAAPSAASSSKDRRKSAGADLSVQKSAPEFKEQAKSVGWVAVSPGLLDQSPEVEATKKPLDYYSTPKWPVVSTAAMQKAAAAPTFAEARAGASGSGPAASAAAAAVPGEGVAGAGAGSRRGSKAAELAFPVAGLDGGLFYDIRPDEFRGLLKSALQSSDLATARRLLTAPLPRSAGVIQCFIERHKSGLLSSFFPTYELFLEEPRKPFFLMSAKKRSKNKTSNYTISLLSAQMLSRAKSEAAMTADDPNYLGKLRSNFTGSEYVGFDAGVNPKSYADASIDRSGSAKQTPVKWLQEKFHGHRRPSESRIQNVRQELCTVLFDNNIMSRSPRKFRVIIPAMLPEDPSKRIVCRPLVESDSLLYQYKQLQASEAGDKPALNAEQLAQQEITVLYNKQPVFEPSVGAFCLNFKGRAQVASVKNFQLVDPREAPHIHKQNSAIFLQFGKMGKDVFTMDVQYPLSIVQAFEISLAGMDTKIICD